MSYLKEMAEGGYNPGNIGPFHNYMVPWLLTSRDVGKEELVLDIGAGQGHCLIPLHRNGWKRLVALDRDSFNFDYFARSFEMTTCLCDIATQPIRLADNSVGAILCFHLIEHLPSPDNLLSESYRVLRKGGKIFLVTPDWRKQYKTFWRDPTHLHPYDKESIARLLRMWRFSAEVYSWNARYGLGRLRAYQWFPKLGMIGEDMLAIGVKS